MSSLLAFALARPASIPVAPSGIRKAGSWTEPFGMCAAVSATITTVVGRTMSKGNRKRYPGSSTLGAFDPSKEVGAMQPLGYWDPLNLMKEGSDLMPQGDPNARYKSEETFRWYREAELKHGRISMVAIVGLASGELWKWPGFEKNPGGMAALNTDKGGAGFAILFLIAGIFELDFWKQDPSKEPGNFGDPVGWTRMQGTPWTGTKEGQMMQWEYSEELRNKELAHCRLAMSGAITSLLLEYNGVDMKAQFSDENGLYSSFTKFAIAAWVVTALWRFSGTPFYIANDSELVPPGRRFAAKPTPALLGAGRALPQLGSADKF